MMLTHTMMTWSTLRQRQFTPATARFHQRQYADGFSVLHHLDANAHHLLKALRLRTCLLITRPLRKAPQRKNGTDQTLPHGYVVAQQDEMTTNGTVAVPGFT